MRAPIRRPSPLSRTVEFSTENGGEQKRRRMKKRGIKAMHPTNAKLHFKTDVLLKTALIPEGLKDLSTEPDYLFREYSFILFSR